MQETVRDTSHSTLQHERAIELLMSDVLAKAKAACSRAASKELVELLFYRPYCKIQFLVDSGIAKRQTASNYLKQLTGADLLKPVIVGGEIFSVNHAFLNLLSRSDVAARIPATRKKRPSVSFHCCWVCFVVGDEGLETMPFSSGNKPLSEQSAAESGAVAAPRDVRLQRLLKCWDDLPESVRVSVDAIVSAHSRRDLPTTSEETVRESQAPSES